jgi:hypothetical protein
MTSASCSSGNSLAANSPATLISAPQRCASELNNALDASLSGVTVVSMCLTPVRRTRSSSSAAAVPLPRWLAATATCHTTTVSCATGRR